VSYQYRIGRPCVEKAIGKDWTFARFTRNVWAELAVEAQRVLPDPIKIALPGVREATLIDAEILRNLHIQDDAELVKAKAENRPPALLASRYDSISKSLLMEAYNAARRYLSPGSPELSGFMDSVVGGSFLFWILLTPNHPGITIDEAYDVFWDLASNHGDDGRKTMEQIIKCCNGTTPEPEKNAACPD
jgi:hypothetical protein